MKQIYIALLTGLLLAGCSTTKNKEIILTDKQQRTALSTAQMPQQYGFMVFPVKGGIAIKAEARVHPNHMASVKMPMNGLPTVHMEGRASRMKMTALLDPSSAVSWIDFNTATDFDCKFMGIENKYLPYRGKDDTGDVDAFQAFISQMRIKQLFIEDIAIFVRMARNSLGPLARNIEDPHIDAVIGYDLISRFSYIRFDYEHRTIEFSATTPYSPNEDLLMSEAAIVPGYGGVAIEGAINGKETPIMLDFAGDYFLELSAAITPFTELVSLGEVAFRNVPTRRPVSYQIPRVGTRMLEEHTVTICPKKGVVYFERPGGK